MSDRWSWINSPRKHSHLQQGSFPGRAYPPTKATGQKARTWPLPGEDRNVAQALGSRVCSSPALPKGNLGSVGLWQLLVEILMPAQRHTSLCGFLAESASLRR